MIWRGPFQVALHLTSASPSCPLPPNHGPCPQLAVYAEFRQDWATAVAHYREAYAGCLAVQVRRRLAWRLERRLAWRLAWRRQMGRWHWRWRWL